MKKVLIAAFICVGFAFAAASTASAAPANSSAISNGQNFQGLERVWYDRYGRWHPNRYYYHGPYCRSVRVCNAFHCWWTRRCY